MNSSQIRPATPADAASICRIYNPYITDSTISFEEEPVSEDAMAARIAACTLPWLVYEEDGVPLGYAYASAWRSRPAYRHAVESSVYVAGAARGRQIGVGLYRALIAQLRALGLRTVIGGIAQPNEASVRLHERLGFRKVAHFEQVGFKHGRWLDVGYWQLHLGQSDTA